MFHIAATSINPADAEAVDISASDHVFSLDCTELHVGVSGDIKVDMIGGSTGTFKNVPAGRFRARVTRVYKAGTTATDLIGLAF